MPLRCVYLYEADLLGSLRRRTRRVKNERLGEAIDRVSLLTVTRPRSLRRGAELSIAVVQGISAYKLI